jgi:hypothetical protein
MIGIRPCVQLIIGPISNTRAQRWIMERSSEQTRQGTPGAKRTYYLAGPEQLWQTALPERAIEPEVRNLLRFVAV